jgi:hypothetical protein
MNEGRGGNTILQDDHTGKMADANNKLRDRA